MQAACARGQLNPPTPSLFFPTPLPPSPSHPRHHLSQPPPCGPPLCTPPIHPPAPRLIAVQMKSMTSPTVRLRAGRRPARSQEARGHPVTPLEKSHSLCSGEGKKRRPPANHPGPIPTSPSPATAPASQLQPEESKAEERRESGWMDGWMERGRWW